LDGYGSRPEGGRCVDQRNWKYWIGLLTDQEENVVIDIIARDLKKVFDEKIVEELLSAYQDAKRNFYFGGLRLSAVEGGRFCEAAFRMLEQLLTAKFTPLGDQINSDKLLTALKESPKAALPESVRIHIPRALRVVYDIRNKRDAAHLADGIDPNVQDATLVIATLDWILAEFVRLYHGVPADAAQKLIEDLVVRRAPAVQDFAGFLKVLRPDLQASDRALLLLYERGAQGATFQQLSDWVHPTMRKNLKRTLESLEHDHARIHSVNGTFHITIRGVQEVERKRLHDLAA